LLERTILTCFHILVILKQRFATKEGICMAASGPNDELEVQEQYNESSIISRIVGNVLKREINDELAPTPRNRDVALFVQKVVNVLDILQSIDKTADGYITLPDEQKLSIQELYDFCLNHTSHPDETDSLHEKIQATMDCVYKNEGSVTNWFNTSSSLCGSIRASLYSIKTGALDDKYQALVESTQAEITKNMLMSNKGIAYLTSYLSSLSLMETQPIDPVIPPAPPPLLILSSQPKPKGPDERNGSCQPQPSVRLSMAEVLAKREEMLAARGETTIEDKLREAREEKTAQSEPLTVQELLLGNAKFQSLMNKP